VKAEEARKAVAALEAIRLVAELDDPDEHLLSNAADGIGSAIGYLSTYAQRSEQYETGERQR
jgi:hypothetical protein